MGCGDELPGMGGVDGGFNFKANCAGWKKLLENPELKQKAAPFIEELSGGEKLSDGEKSCGGEKFCRGEKSRGSEQYRGGNFFKKIRLAPMTGAQENIGWPDEQGFYEPFFRFVKSLGSPLSIGDGCPDEKLLYGIKAAEAVSDFSCAVFLKPYPNEKIFERIEWSRHVASVFGIDIDAYNIVTMRNKVHLEKKTAALLNEVRRAAKVPFAVKGVFTQSDIELVKELKPEIIFISNHGGRVDNHRESTAEFLAANIKELKNYCDKIWVDGGIRDEEDAAVAFALGADEVLAGRLFVREFLKEVC